jgi:glycine oxidase
MKYVIIGNGILAHSIAYRLLDNLGAHDQIVLIGPMDRPGSATLAAAAMLNAFGEVGHKPHSTPAEHYHFELSRTATRAWPTFVQTLADRLNACEPEADSDFGLRFGTYIIHNSAADELDDRNFAAIHAALLAHHEPFEWADPSHIPNYHPSTAKRALRALYLPNEGWINPRAVLRALDTVLAHDARVERIDCIVTRLNMHHGRITAALLHDNTMVEGDAFLLANGASASRVLDQSELGLAIQPVFYGVGVSLQLECPGFPHRHCIRTPNRGGACGIYSAPYFLGTNARDDHTFVGASNWVTPAPHHHPRVQSVQRLLRGAVEEINGHFADAHIVQANVGWRPTTQDTFPLLGATDCSNLYLATGTKRDGFHLSPTLSLMIADQMLGKSIDGRLSLFKPERELIHHYTRQEAIDAYLASQRSELYQQHYHPANLAQDTAQIERWRHDIEQLHDQIHAHDWGIPPDMVTLYRSGHAR